MFDVARLTQLISLLDMTRLVENDDLNQISAWLDALPALTTPVAALCVYPEFLPVTSHYLHLNSPQVALATVVNFPQGEQPLPEVLEDIRRALALGATEIDCVLPYQALMRGEEKYVADFLTAVRSASATACLKIIIESGELVTAQQVAKATELVIASGADFVKTSTGKVPVGCTTEAARIILTTIAAAERTVGFKASGGVKTLAQALEIVALYEQITGRPAEASGLRIGASSLLQDILQNLG